MLPIILRTYPSNIFYGLDHNVYHCTSFIGENKEEQGFEFYQLVVRVQDGAYQVFKATKNNFLRLYMDPACKFPTEVYYSATEWKRLPGKRR